MKIECTQEEKEAILRTAASSTEYCVFNNTSNIKCDYTIQCEKCIEQNIEWVIKEGEEE